MGQSAYTRPQYTPFGALFQPIGYIKGRPVWPVLGGAPEDEGASGTGDAGQSAGDGTGDEQGTGTDTTTDDGAEGSGNESQGDSNTQPSAEDLAAELARVRARMQAADRRASAAEAKVKEFEDKDKSELQKATETAQEATRALEEAQQKLRDQQMLVAFHSSNKYDWHDPSLALKELDTELITVEDDGTVKGMDKALEKLAKAKPFLVKKEEKSGGKSGGSFNGGGGKSSGPDASTMATKYPAIRSHLRDNAPKG